MLELLTDPEAWIALLALTSLEIVLGIDNIVFIAIVVGRLPAEDQPRGRSLGLMFAMLTRIMLLFALTWLTGLTTPLVKMFGHGLSGRDLILLGGGLFLLWKSTTEIHHMMNPSEDAPLTSAPKAQSFGSALLQIALIDLVFSLDSVITAIGMAEHLTVMVVAVLLATAVMLFAAKPITDFVAAHPTIKVMALSFLTLIGVLLVAESFHVEVPKGYVYFAMAYSLGVELLNMRIRRAKDSHSPPPPPQSQPS